MGIGILDYYPEVNYDDSDNLYSGAREEAGQSFKHILGGAVTLNHVKFYLRKVGSPTGTAVAKLYAHTGTFGTTGKPTGAALATSDSFDVSTLTTSYQLIEFTFSTPYSLANDTPYCVTIEYSGGNSSNYVQIGVRGSGSHQGNYCYKFAGTWNYLGGPDAIFYAYSNQALGPRAIGTPVTAASGALTPTIPAGVVAGDKLLLFVYNRTNSLTFSASAGWDEEYDPGGTSNGSHALYSRTYAGGDGNPTVTPSSSGDSTIAVIIAVANWNTTTLFDVSVSSGMKSAPPSSPYGVTIDTFDTSTNGALSFFMWASLDDNTWDYQESGGGVQLVSQNETSGTDAALCIVVKTVPVAGATGYQIANQTTKGGDAGRYLTFAVKPAPVVTITAITVSDTGTGTDLVKVNKTLRFPDSGAGTDTPLGHKGLKIIETGVGADATLRGKSFVLSDVGAGDDVILKGIAQKIIDSGVGVDGVLLGKALNLPDAGLGVDSVFRGKSFGLSDIGAGVDQALRGKQFTLSDSGIGADEIKKGLLFQLLDIGIGVDGVLRGKLLGLGDAMIGVDQVLVSKALNVSDTAAGTDAAKVGKTLLFLDTGTGVDAVVVTAGQNILVADFGVGDDGLLLAKSLSLADFGIGLDEVVVTGGGPEPSLDFVTLLRRRRR